MWQDHAACAGQSTELFFPDKGESDKRAKSICHTCQVKQACLTFALKHERGSTRYGIYGDLTATERNTLFGTI